MARSKDKQNKKGRGWHGDSRGHAEAGRKGGQARGRKSKDENTNPNFPGQGMTNDMGFDEELTDDESVI